MIVLDCELFISFFGTACIMSCAIVLLLPYWLCDCAIVTILIVWLCNCYHVDCVIVIESCKICILIVRLCKNLHFDCAIVWKYAFWLCDCVKICNLIVGLCDCAWLCWLCVIVWFTLSRQLGVKISSGVYQKSANNGPSTIKEAHRIIFRSAKCTN